MLEVSLLKINNLHFSSLQGAWAVLSLVAHVEEFKTKLEGVHEDFVFVDTSSREAPFACGLVNIGSKLSVKKLIFNYM